MKKVDKSTNRNARAARVSISDLQEIVQIAEDFSDGVEVSTESYEVENVDELADIDGEFIRTLTISTSLPILRVEMRPGWISVYASSSNSTAVGAVDRIMEIFAKRTRWGIWALDKAGWIIWGCFLGGFSVLADSAYLHAFEMASRVTLLLVYIALAAGLARVAFLASSRWQSRIDLHDRIPHGFLRRNRDDILLRALSVLIAFALGILARDVSCTKDLDNSENEPAAIAQGTGPAAQPLLPAADSQSAPAPATAPAAP